MTNIDIDIDICHLYARAMHHVKSHFLKMVHEDVANYWEPFHSHVIFLLEEIIIHLKVGGSQTNLQQFHEGFNLQNGLFCRCVITVEFISDDL
jgi:hypothetical protein